MRTNMLATNLFEFFGSRRPVLHPRTWLYLVCSLLSLVLKSCKNPFFAWAGWFGTGQHKMGRSSEESTSARKWVFDLIFFSSENWETFFSYAEISVGTTFEISDQKPYLWAHRFRGFSPRNWTSRVLLVEISRVLPTEISASNKKLSQFSLEKKSSQKDKYWLLWKL